LMFMFWLMRR